MDTKNIRMLKTGKSLIVVALVAYLLSAGLTYAVFSYFHPGVTQMGVDDDVDLTNTSPQGRFAALEKKYAKLPKTEECPLNGRMQSKPEKENWEKRRPIGIMVENSTAARPQSGLSFADVVYEAVAEGGITRFMAVYYCKDAEIVGPVRSARTYYLDWISEYGDYPLYVHVGGANSDGPADALGQIRAYGWQGYNDLDGIALGLPVFKRDYGRLGEVATEHTMYTFPTTDWQYAAKDRDLTNTSTNDKTGAKTAWNEDFTPWKFKNDAALDQRPAKLSASFNFSNTQAGYLDDYAVGWKYDKDSNSFLRTNGNKAAKDLNTNQQISAKNVVIQFMPMSIANDGYNEEGHGAHTLYDNKGTGKAIFLIDGKQIAGTWQKPSRTSRTIYYDASGNEIQFNRGLIWIETLPTGQAVKIS